MEINSDSLSLNKLINNLQNETGINIKDKIKKTIDLTKPGSGENIYDTLNNIDDSNKVFYIAAFSFTVFFFSKVNITINSIFGIVMGVLLVYYLYNRNKSNADNFNDDMLYKITAINTITNKRFNYLYLDTDIVELISNIIDFRKYSKDEFDSLIHQLNLFLKLNYQINLGVNRCADNIEVAKVIANNALNKLTSFFHNIENFSILNKKLELSIEILQKILYTHIDEMTFKCNQSIKKKGIDVNTRFVEENRFPSPNDLNTEVEVSRYRNIVA